MNEKVKTIDAGELIKTSLSNKTLVLMIDQDGKKAILKYNSTFGEQYIYANGIEFNSKDEKFEWDCGNYFDNFEQCYAKYISTDNKKINWLFECLSSFHYPNYIKSIIEIELGTKNDAMLDAIYEKYIAATDEINLISDNIINMLDLPEIRDLKKNQHEKAKDDITDIAHKIIKPRGRQR